MKFLLLLLLVGGCAGLPAPEPQAVKELAPSGRLKAAINFGNTVLVQRGTGGEPRGVSPALATELGRRLGVPVDFVIYEAAGRVTDAARSSAWDVAFVAIDPKRAQDIDFTAPYVVIEGTYMVRNESPLRSVADFDRAGVRIAVGAKSAYDLFLSRELKRAQIVRAPTSPEAIALFVNDRLEAAANVKQPLVAYARANPGYRVIEPGFMKIEQAMGTPRGRPNGARYLRAFVDEMKSSGFVERNMTQP